MNLLQTAPGAAPSADSLLAPVPGRSRLQGSFAPSSRSQSGSFADLVSSFTADTAASDLPSGASQASPQKNSAPSSGVRQMVQAVLLKSSLKQTQPTLPAVPASVLSASQNSNRQATPQSIPDVSGDQNLSSMEESSQQTAAATQNSASAADCDVSQPIAQVKQAASVLLADPKLIALSGARQCPLVDAASATEKKGRASTKSGADPVGAKPTEAKAHVEHLLGEVTSTANSTAAPQAAGNLPLGVSEFSETVAADPSVPGGAPAVRERRETANQQAVSGLVLGESDPHQGPVSGEFSAMAPVTSPLSPDSADHLAFALQVAPVQGDHAGSDPQNGILKATAVAAAAGAGAGSAHAAQIVTAISQTGFSAGAPQAREARSTGSPEPALSTNDPHLEPKTAPGDPLRVLRVQFAGSNEQRVDVRVADAGGQLRVSVRSSEPGLTQALQDHMPELTSRLSEQSFHASVWMPSSSGPASGPRSAMAFSVNVNPEGQGQQGRREREQNHPKPEWIDDLERNPLRTQNRRS